MTLEAAAQHDLEQVRRDFLNSVYGLLSGLAVHDIRNDALIRPFQNFERSLKILMESRGELKGVEIKCQDGLLLIMGLKVAPHFSIVEAQRLIRENMEVALIESMTFLPDAPMDSIGDVFSKWALHCSVHQKPKPLQAQAEGIEIVFLDPNKATFRQRNKQLMLSPQYALQHYYLLREHTEEFFQGMVSQSVISQKAIRRELLELCEIAKVAPHQLVALSLIREEKTAENPLASSVSQALATGLLSMVLAKELHFSIREQLNLGLVGLMYNVGLLGDEASAVMKNDRLTPVEYKRVLDAQASGVYKLIRLQGSSRPVLERLLAIFEHSRGAQVKSVALTLESRLLRLVSQYVALTSERPFREAYTPAEAIKLLGSKASQPSGGDLDPILYYVFVRFLGIYPMGSLVLLSNHSKAVVFRPSGEKIGVPMVKIVEEGGSDRSRLMDLAQGENLKIVKSLDPKREGVAVTGYFFE